MATFQVASPSAFNFAKSGLSGLSVLSNLNMLLDLHISQKKVRLIL